MGTWQERMAELAEEAGFNAALSGACGWCTDEGDEYRPAVFEYSRLDALEVARSGYLGAYAQAHANSKDLKKQKEIADFLAAPDKARTAGVTVKVDVSERQLGKAEFFARRAEGVTQMMSFGNYPSIRAAEIEWMKREAEMETGYLRNDPNPVRHKKWEDTYDRLRAHDYR